MANITLRVNGRARTVDVEPTTPLLYVLRNDLELQGPRFGCGLGQCGACAAIVGGNLARTCSTALGDVGDDHVITLEGLGTAEHPHPLQQALVEALRTGHLAGAGLDVVETEPLPNDSPLRDTPNLVLTPHAAIYSLPRCTGIFRLPSRTARSRQRIVPRLSSRPTSLKAR